MNATALVTFLSLLTGGLEYVDAKAITLEALPVRWFKFDDSVPAHQVTIALEEARLAVEMAMQVRASAGLEATASSPNMQS